MASRDPGRSPGSLSRNRSQGHLAIVDPERSFRVQVGSPRNRSVVVIVLSEALPRVRRHPPAEQIAPPFARFQARSRRRRRGRRGRRRSSGYRTVTPRRGAAHRAAVRPPNGVSRIRASIFIGTSASRVLAAIPVELVASARASLRSLLALGTRCDPSGVERVSSP